MNKKILIIDDEFHVVKILQFKLNQAGYNVIYALDGVEGIRLAKEELPDIILLDIMMPVMNGYEVFSALRADENTDDIPVVMVTALTQKDDEEKAEKLGIADYIYKPFSTQTVLETVQKIVEE